VDASTTSIGSAEPESALPGGHPAPHAGKIGVLLVNLGTPEGTDKASMRRYLKEFLSDRRVIEWPRAYWYPILYGIVLNVRPKRSGALYDKIWNREQNESPLRTITRAQGEKLGVLLKAHETVVVDWAMRYGKPSIEEAAERLIAQGGCDRVLLFPLYPQYSAATTATVNDKVFEMLAKRRFQPAIRIVPPYYDDPAYIEALAQSIGKHLATLAFEPEVLIASYHGIPKSYSEKGDPYYHHCMKTTQLLRERLGLDEKRLITTFQSRFGPEEWLKPYTDGTVERLAREGIRSIAVFNPGFAADCLETLQEIAMEAAETFHHAGGRNFSHIPCLNDSDEGVRMLGALVRRELSGWL
jgi:ferrochelatase